MGSSFLLFAVIISSGLLAFVRSIPLENTAICTSTILWRPCPDDAKFDCASFQVPLDYAHPEVGNATLAVARFNATKEPRLGTIFTNPGGPGGSGVAFLIGSAGELINAVTNGQYDIVSWDPRGVNQSTPKISCGFTSAESLSEFFGDTIPGVGFEARGNFTDQDDLNAFFAKVNDTDTKFVQTGQKCVDSDGAFMKYMGTAATVRDMVALTDCTDGPGRPVNYWGFSYGTVIGTIFVNMFPQRVGRVVIDGVVDAIAWTTEPTFESAPKALSAIEWVLQGFAEKCVEAGPQNCTLAQNGSTAVSIVGEIHSLIDLAYDQHKAGISNITSFEVRGAIAGELYTPTTWDTELVPQLQSLAASLANDPPLNVSAIPQRRSSSHGGLKPRLNRGIFGKGVDPSFEEFFSELVITCIDSVDQANVTTKRVFEEVVLVAHEVSPTFAEAILETGDIFCHRFPVRSVERFTGPFNHKLANTILVIGNKADPITPFPGAQRIATALGDGARLLEQNGFGHTSIAENSDCTQGIVREYFLNATLPKKGLICNTDQELFPTNNTLISPAGP